MRNASAKQGETEGWQDCVQGETMVPDVLQGQEAPRKQSQPPLKPPKLGRGTLDIHLTSHHSLGVCDELESKSLVGSPPSTIWVLLSSSLYSVQGKEGDVRCGVQSAARETGFYRSEMKPDKRQG